MLCTNRKITGIKEVSLMFTTFSDFARLVKQMRIAQKQYFKTRSKEVLIESKRLENLVDKTIENLSQEA